MIPQQPEDYLNGKIILIDKEIDWTSFDVVNKLRNALRTELGIKKIKVGHTGTLDPLATGLVILCTGKATKRIEQFQNLDKEYVARITFGATTPSFDLETTIDQTFPTEHISLRSLEEALERLSGTISQVPPAFSAKQVDGKRAYEMARLGEKVKLSPREVQIFDTEILSFELPELILRIHCSKGTYIRSFADDLGQLLASGAYLSGLRRTKIGDFHVNDAKKINDFVKKLKPL
jgi:tRNA pseudouridine55 synthase